MEDAETTCSHRPRTATPSTSPLSCRRCSCTLLRDRKGNASPRVVGSVYGAGWWSARRNRPRAATMGAGSRGGASSALSPANHSRRTRTTGTPEPGADAKRHGHWQRQSRRQSGKPSLLLFDQGRGSRTTGNTYGKSSPKRNSLLSQPSPTSVSARCARSVCCSWSRARTRAGYDTDVGDRCRTACHEGPVTPGCWHTYRLELSWR